MQSIEEEKDKGDKEHRRSSYESSAERINKRAALGEHRESTEKLNMAELKEQHKKL